MSKVKYEDIDAVKGHWCVTIYCIQMQVWEQQTEVARFEWCEKNWLNVLMLTKPPKQTFCIDVACGRRTVFCFVQLKFKEGTFFTFTPDSKIVFQQYELEVNQCFYSRNYPRHKNASWILNPNNAFWNNTFFKHYRLPQ